MFPQTQISPFNATRPLTSEDTETPLRYAVHNRDVSRVTGPALRRRRLVSVNQGGEVFFFEGQLQRGRGAKEAYQSRPEPSDANICRRFHAAFWRSHPLNPGATKAIWCADQTADTEAERLIGVTGADIRG